ncbi:hypothetical protein AVEN_139520-1 [Araneus ventricosus]|uniref:Flavin-containing monooxygenase n=1 Tax=Araneus ventricosus TaxID=182803 RepID=A0A4Y2TPN3_ARAVE|nr:hypothetical protein AVEN_139520-1 [Araneus ventricosus]
MYTVKPNHWVFSKDPVLNDHFGSKLLSGSIVQKPNIQRFTENGVIFEGDKEVTECDVVIMATGYTWKFPFLEEDRHLGDGRRQNQPLQVNVSTSSASRNVGNHGLHSYIWA